MHTALSQDAADANVPYRSDEPRAANERRVSATGTLLGVAVSLVLAKALAVGAPVSPAAAPQNRSAMGATPVTVIAPEFCKDQTWPYIDARCLRRIDNPAPPAEARSASTAADTATPTAAAGTVNGNAGSSPPPNAGPPAAARQAGAGIPPVPAANAPQGREQVVQSAFPTADASAASQNDLQSPGADSAVGALSYQPLNGASRPHRSRHWRHSFFHFGF